MSLKAKRYKIIHFILRFLHERIFRHDPGRMPNKFTNLIYAILMPIHYIIEHNSTLRYDFIRDIYIIDNMEFSRDLLRHIHNTPHDSIFENERDLLWNFYIRLISCKGEDGCDSLSIPQLNVKLELIDEPKMFHGSEDIETDSMNYMMRGNYIDAVFGTPEEREKKRKILQNKQREETMKSNIGIAKVCHEANRQYCIDNKLPTQALWNELPVTQQNSIIHGVRQVVADRKMTATKMHETWMEYKASEGWKYADKLDAAKRLHPNMVPFNKLPKVERAKDMLFIKTVKAELKK